MTALTAARHPLATYLLALTIVSTAPLLWADARPGSVASHLGPLAENVWAATFAAGAAITLVGIRLRDRRDGLLVEQVGLTCLVVGCVVYVVAAFVHVGWGAGFSAGLLAGYGGACADRWWHIQEFLRQAKMVEEQASGESPP